MKRMKLYLKYDTKRQVEKASDLLGVKHDTFYRMAIYHGCLRFMLNEDPILRRTLDADCPVIINIPDNLNSMWQTLVEGRFEVNGEKKIQSIYRTRKLNGQVVNTELLSSDTYKSH